MFNKQQKVYYPRAIVQGKPVETGTIARSLAMISTVSNSEAQGKSVHIKGLGYFRYVPDTEGVKFLNDFDFQKQVKAVRIEFIPERTKLSNGTYTRALVDSDELEWIELSPDTMDSTPGGEDGGDGDLEENPLD